MITFTQLCEMLTHDQRYSWFGLPAKLSPMFTSEEKSLIYIEVSVDEHNLRVWYPRDKFYHNVRDSGHLQKLISSAMDAGDWEEIKRLKEKVKIQ